MAHNQSHPRRRQSSFETLNLREFHSRHVFKHLQYDLFRTFAGSDLIIAMPAILQNQIVRGNGRPKLKIAHWRYPLIDFFYVFKLLHVWSVPNLHIQLQISEHRRGTR